MRCNRRSCGNYHPAEENNCLRYHEQEVDGCETSIIKVEAISEEEFDRIYLQPCVGGTAPIPVLTTGDKLKAALGVRKALMEDLDKLTTGILELDKEIRALFALQNKEKGEKFNGVLNAKSN